MSRQPKVSLSALIQSEVAPKAAAALAEPSTDPVIAPPAEPEPAAPPEPPRVAQPLAQSAPAPLSAPQRPAPKTTLRARSKQLSLYLELPVYDQLREIAHVERVKMHQLVVEGIDLLFRKRGQPPIRELMKRAKSS